MKEISSQLYGLEAELDSTTETNGTTCFCVDTGTVFVAYGGIWYEQRNVYWKVGGAAESDLAGYSRYIPSAAAVDDLVCFNAQDTGDRYVAYCGHWFKQPIPWSDTALLTAAAAQSPAELPAVTSDDNGDVLTVVSGSWAKAAPSGGVTEVELTFGENGSIISTIKAGALWEAVTTGPVIFVVKTEGAVFTVYTLVSAANIGAYLFEVNLSGGETTLLVADTADDYPTFTEDVKE